VIASFPTAIGRSPDAIKRIFHEGASESRTNQVKGVGYLFTAPGLGMLVFPLQPGVKAR